MIILDTNVLSALMRDNPDPVVIDWLDAQPRTSIWTSAVSVFEIRFGLHVMPSGKRKQSLVQKFEILLERISNRVAPFDVSAAEIAADLMASRQKKGRPGELRDTMIAGIVLATNATLATRNISHFQDLAGSILNPWKHN